MQIYKTLRKFALISCLTILPYVCDSCSYSGDKEITEKTTQETNFAVENRQLKENLEYKIN